MNHMNPVKLKFIASSLVAALVCQGSALAQSQDIDAGLRHMKAKNYGLAARFFHKAATHNPKDAVARYHFANSLVFLKRHEEAMNEYRKSYELDPYSVVSGYCRKALLSYKTALPPTFNTQVRASGVDVKSGKSSRAVAMIRSQLASEKMRHNEYATSLSENVVKAGDTKVQEIKSRADEEIRLLYRYGPLVPTGSSYRRIGRAYDTLNPYQQKEVDSQVAEIRRQAEDDIKKEQSVADERSLTIKRWAEARKDSLDSVAENLEGQLNIPTSPSGIKLKAEGTGLYVRNYELTKQKRNLPQTRYSMARFVDKLDSEQTQAEEDLDSIEVDEQENVRGKVINFNTSGS